jgi:hypothetical protein
LVASWVIVALTNRLLNETAMIQGSATAVAPTVFTSAVEYVTFAAPTESTPGRSRPQRPP